MQRGYDGAKDGAKKLTGRKRFVVCATLGLWLEVLVVPANVRERAGAEQEVANQWLKRAESKNPGFPEQT